MNVLCSDKTGTITEGRVRVHAALDAQGTRERKVLLHAYLNATNETGFVNPIDEAIREFAAPECEGWRKLDELPYDFLRKRLSILFEKDGRHLLDHQGRAAANPRRMCASKLSDRSIDHHRCRAPRDRAALATISAIEGHRVLGVAYRDCGTDTQINAKARRA